MKKRLRIIGLALFVGLLTASQFVDALHFDFGQTLGINTPRRQGLTKQSFGAMHLPFIQNKGQVDNEHVKFVANNFFGTTFIMDDSLTYSVVKNERGRQTTFSFRELFLDEHGIKLALDPKGAEPQNIKITDIRGDDIKNWKNNIKTYNKVTFDEVWPGVNVYLQNRGVNFEKFFELQPNADISNITILLSGIDDMAYYKGTKELFLKTKIGALSLSAPVAKQGDKLINVEYQIKDDNTYGFVINDPQYNPNEPLLIDPLLGSSFIGASGDENNPNVAVDSNGNIFVVGTTGSTDFPATAIQTSYGGGVSDIFIAKFNSDLTTLQSAAFLGGSADDNNPIIKIDSNDKVFIAGVTDSTSFPSGSTAGGDDDIFLFKIDNNLSTLEDSLRVGGTGRETINDIAFDGTDVFIAGTTRKIGTSNDFPFTSGTYDDTFDGTEVVFVSKLSEDLDNSITTSLGNSNEEDPKLAIDTNGNVFVTGTTNAENFPDETATTGSTQSFVAKLDNTLTNLSASYLVDADYAKDISITIYDNNIFVASGQTTYDSIKISKFSNNLSLSDEREFTGTNADNRSPDLVIDSSGNLLLAGVTNTEDVITVTSGVYDESYNTAGSNIFLVKIDPSDLSTTAASFLGNSIDSVKLATTANNEIIVVGVTDDTNSMPIATNAYDDSLGAQDIFVAKFDSDLTANEAPVFSSSENVSLEATAANKNVSLTWDTSAFSDPDSEDGDTIVGYKIMYGTTEGTYDDFSMVDSNAGSTTISGLDNDTTYYFEIVAYDIEGLESNQTESPSTATPQNEAPTWDNVETISAEANDGDIDLDWAPGASDDEGIDSYRIEWGADYDNLDSNATVDGTDTIYSITGIAGGQNYYIKVFAIDTDGEEVEKMATVVAMPNNAPNKIENLTLTSVEDGGVSISWDQGSDPDNNLSGYEIRYAAFPSDFDNYTESISINSVSTTSYTITGLTNGIPYFLTVTGVDDQSAYGEGADQISGTPTTDSSNNPPEDVTIDVISQSGAAVVSWETVADPDDNLDGYRIYYSVNENYFTNYKEVGEGSTSITINGLSNETEYFFVARAYDTDNTFSVNASNKESIIPTSFNSDNESPTAPSDLEDTSGNNTITLTWTASSDSDGTVDGYRIYYGTTSEVYDSYYPQSGYINDTTATVTGLNNQQVYYFTVKAIDDDEAWSEASSQISGMPTGDNHAPNTPTGLQAVPENQEVALSWNAATDADNNLDGYIVYYGTTSGTYTEETEILDDTSLTIQGLTNGTTYYFVVKAIDTNEVLSEASDGASATPVAATITAFSVTDFIATSDQRIVSEDPYLSGKISEISDLSNYTFGVEVVGDINGELQTIQGSEYLLNGNIFSKNLADVVRETYPSFTNFDLNVPLEVRISLQTKDDPDTSFFQTGSQTFTPNTSVEATTAFTGTGSINTFNVDLVLPIDSQTFEFTEEAELDATSEDEDGLNVVIDEGTIISKSPTYFNTWSGELEVPRKITTPTTSEAVFYGGFTPINDATISFGFEHIRLLFSTAVSIHIPISTNYNDQTLNIFTSQDGVVWTAADECTVINGLCGFEATHTGRFSIGKGYTAPVTPSASSSQQSSGVSRYRGMGGGHNKERHGGYDTNDLNSGFFGAPYASTITIKPEKITVRSLCEVPEDYYVTRGLYNLIGMIAKEEILCDEDAPVTRKDLKSNTRDICSE